MKRYENKTPKEIIDSLYRLASAMTLEIDSRMLVAMLEYWEKEDEQPD